MISCFLSVSKTNLVRSKVKPGAMAEHLMRVPTNALSDAESDAPKHEVDDAEDRLNSC